MEGKINIEGEEIILCVLLLGGFWKDFWAPLGLFILLLFFSALIKAKH